MSVHARKYPIGVDDFKEIVEEGYFYWDKTLFLKEFYEDTGKTILILRPRRWAKSTTLSMAKYFFDITEPELSKSLFSKTKLATEEPTFFNTYFGQFPVLSISFSECYAPSWEIMENWLRTIIYRAYNDHFYLLDIAGFLKEHERLEFEAILKKDHSVFYPPALKNLTALLHRYHKKRVIVLIDEYDKPVIEAYQEGYYKEALKFLTSAFTGCLKSNPHIEKGLMTGVLRVAKAGYLSGLNNLEVYSFLDKRFADKYGVTEEEIKEALKFEGLIPHANEARSFYDGYDTAIEGLRLYNPWSIVNYLKNKEIVSYWVETGRTDYLAEAVWSAPMETRHTIASLLDGEKCTVPFAIDVDFNLISCARGLWSLLYFAGYLTGTREGLECINARIPNDEVKRELSAMWRGFLEMRKLGAAYDDFLCGLLSGNDEATGMELRTIINTLGMSFHDTAKTPEAFYHGLFLSLLFPLHKDGYRIESNREKGKGRPDIVLHPPEGKPALIIEMKTRSFKRKRDVDKDEDLEPDALAAIKQIKQLKYYEGFSDDVRMVILCGVACVRKFVFVKMEEFVIK